MRPGTTTEVRLLEEIARSRFRRDETVLGPLLAFQAFRSHFWWDGTVFLGWLDGSLVWSSDNPSEPASVDEALRKIVMRHPERDHILRAHLYPNDGAEEMKSSDFPEANMHYHAPPGEEHRVYTISAWTDGDEVIELWRPTWRERLSILFFGKVWLRLMGSRPQPAAVEAKRRMFE